MNNQIKINKIARTFGVALTVHGFRMIKSSYGNLKPVHFPFGFVKESINKIKVMSLRLRDYNYYFTSWENEEKMLAIIWNILKHFKWIAEKWDCDDRAKAVSALHSLLFGLNSCGELYCKVTNIKTGKTGLHWANIVITWDGSCYLFDVDNSGLAMKLIPNKPISMGKWNYEFKNRVRF